MMLLSWAAPAWWLMTTMLLLGGMMGPTTGAVVVVDAQSSTTCDCHSGTVLSSNPCSCNCPADFSLPQCRFAKVKPVTIRMKYRNTTAPRWTSAAAVTAIRNGAGRGVGTTDAKSGFVFTGRAVSTDMDVILATFAVRGEYAETLLSDVASKASWTQAAGVVVIDAIAEPKVAAPIFNADDLLLATIDVSLPVVGKATIELTIMQLIFFAIGLVIIIVLPAIDFCFFGNDQGAVQDMILDGVPMKIGAKPPVNRDDDDDDFTGNSMPHETEQPSPRMSSRGAAR